MDSQIVDAVIDWDSTPFSGGYEGLRELADGEFSGAITEGTAWAFMLNGRVIGIKDGTMSAFEQADGTAYIAPTPALPLLYVMQTRGDKQAEYYTNNKSISEADSTLSSGGFTGYIELSENVLSGDYYTVYYGGKSMSVAFVGNSRKLLTDEEAFERADDEVGIYTVYEADLEVIDIPERAGATSTADKTDEDSNSSPSDDPDSSTADDTDVSLPDETTVDTRSDSTVTDSSNQTQPGNEKRPQADEQANSPSGTASPRQSAASSDGGAAAAPKTGHRSAAADAAAGPSNGSSKEVFSDEARWRNSKTIPSLDPSDDPGQDETTKRRRKSKPQSTTQQSSSRSLSRGQLQKRLKRAEQIMQKAEAQHEQLVQERDEIKTERDEAQAELDTVRAKLSEAEAEIEQIESQLASGGSSSVQETVQSGGQSMSTTEALQGTNLLVRYASKGDGTLADAISGSAEQETVKKNLRIDPHTTFNTDQVSVDGQPFESFLEDRIELAFVRWLTEECLFDIQQTGNQTELSGIYETLPEINRAELQGTVSLGTDEEGDELTATFDLVVRDKRDRPLFVADFNESKQPVGSGMVNSLVRDGSEIIQREESFAAAFAVTTSYYEGAALDAATDATGGGLLSASRGKSFVYISRKQGFHLCLVEKLGETFDLHVPEL